MKKIAALATAGVLTATLGLGVACGGGSNEDETPEVPDVMSQAYENPDATLTLSGSIDKTSAKNLVSEDLFGIFLEDINYASYALDDNMVCNGSFEYLIQNKPYAWAADGVSMTATSQESVFKSNDNFDTRVNPTSASITVATAGGSLSNTGYVPVPMSVKEGVKYTFSAFIKATDYSGEIGVELAKGSEVLASGSVNVAKSNDWVKYRTTLTATGTQDEEISLKLTFRATGGLYLDNVTMETNDSTVGIKNYLYDVIADLSPSFIRFPGGCVIEGKNMDSAYDWKNSVGATTVQKQAGGVTIADTVPSFTYTLNEDGQTSEVTTRGEQATRVANTDIWQNNNNYYEMEYGLGFYEYFILCDKIGAGAIPIVNCGYSCQVQSPGGTGIRLEGRHGNHVDDYAQDVLDLICFAKGSVTSSDPNEAYWAQVRTDMGHAAPFKMDYVGIGNEQWGNYYRQYYEKILTKLIEAAEDNPLYATVKPIVGNCTMFVHCEYPSANRKGSAVDAAKTFMKDGSIISVGEYGVVDQHYYMNYTDFLSGAMDNFYKDYVRLGDNAEEAYEVFVGEYSANSDLLRYPDNQNESVKFSFTNNSWITALSEAAMMTTYERNGDVIKLAAYAPMFGNLKPAHTQWAVNMMFYDNNEVVKTPNYYVQQLFMKNAGDYKVTSSLSFASGKAPQTVYTSTNRSSFTRTLDDVYYVTTADKETGDIIIKIVNAGEGSYKMNLSLGELSVSLKGIAAVTKISGAQPKDVNTLQSEEIYPTGYTLGFSDGTIGFTVDAYSVSAIRVKIK